MRTSTGIFRRDDGRWTKYLNVVTFLARYPFSAPGAIIVPLFEPSSHARDASKAHAYEAAEETGETGQPSSAYHSVTGEGQLGTPTPACQFPPFQLVSGSVFRKKDSRSIGVPRHRASQEGQPRGRVGVVLVAVPFWSEADRLVVVVRPLHLVLSAGLALAGDSVPAVAGEVLVGAASGPWPGSGLALVAVARAAP